MREMRNIKAGKESMKRSDLCLHDLIEEVYVEAVSYYDHSHQIHGFPAS